MNCKIAENVLPPSGNTGVLNTKEKKVDFSIDWLEFTIKDYDEDLINELKLFLGNGDSFIDVDRGMLGYKKQEILGNIKLLSDGNENMGIHIIISGQGCRELESRYPETSNFLEFVERFLSMGAKFTRIDYALDDYFNFLDLKVIEEHLKKGHLTTRYRKYKKDFSAAIGGDKLGETLYIGTRTSSSIIRIYDKQLEQNTDYSWNRLEFETREDICEKCIKYLLQTREVESIVNIIANYVDFKEYNESDSNKSRWKSCDWWTSFLNCVKKVKLGTTKILRTIEDKKEWLLKQVSPTLSAVLQAEGGDMDFIFKMIRYGETKISNLLKQQIEIYRKLKMGDDKLIDSIRAIFGEVKLIY